MIACYRLPGLLAVIALIIYTFIILAVFKLWPVTLTLAGIAGFILSIGIAVDANILIFERTKEELRAGVPLLRAIETGFERAWASIRDSNVSSIITSLILIWFGTSFIKGFAITLIIGILVSMFSAITITRTFLRLTNGASMEHRLWLFGVKKKKEEQQN
jgi:preprotein translocase subunit SecD